MSDIERGKREASERGQRMERDKLYMYICQFGCVCLSNNCMCVTNIHMYVYICKRDWESEERGKKDREREERDKRKRAESGKRRIVYVYLLN